MNQLIKIPRTKEIRCDLCGEKKQGRFAYVVQTDDSMEFLCEECGDFVWRVLNEMMGHFSLIVNKKKMRKNRDVQEGGDIECLTDRKEMA